MRVGMGAKELVELGLSCPRGKIMRAGFTRKDGVRVGPACVPDKGEPGKTPAARRFLPELGPRPLKGWKKDQPASERRRRLRTLVREEGCTDGLRTINAIANVTTDHETERKLRADYRHVRAQKWCRLKTKARR